MRNRCFGVLIILIGSAGVVLSDGPPEFKTAAPNNLTMPLPENDAVPVGPVKTPYFGNENGAGDDRIWGSFEYLLWQIKAGNIPPLVTASPPASNGILGAQGTTTLFGDHLNYDAQSGGRFTLGAWLDCDHKIGIEGNYFFLASNSAGFDAGSAAGPGSGVIARPFFNVITGLQDSELVAFPGVVAGNIHISSQTNLQGAELNLLCNLCCLKGCQCNSGLRVDLLGGMRYLNLKENLDIAENLTFLPTAPPPFVPGSTINVVDQFETTNHFYGGQIGARAEWWRGRAFVNLTGQVAIGDTHQQLNVNGTTVFTDPAGLSIRQPGGLLALPSNMGSHSRDEFSVVPEVGINVGYHFTKHICANVGYSFLYWNNVARPGDQIDFGVNPTQLPSAGGPGTLAGPARPAPLFRDSDFWAQGINVGLYFRW